jgi:hypothetical protein
MSEINNTETAKLFGALNSMATLCHRMAVSKGFYDKEETELEFVSRSCNNMHDEVSELHTAMRGGHLEFPCDKAAKMEEFGIVPLTSEEEEIADIMIRALDYCARRRLSAGDIVHRKYRYNATRAYRHGGKLA